MNENIVIREETQADFHNTEAMVRRSFWNIHWPGCNEHVLVRVIRDSGDYLPQFSRIAELDGKIAGAVYYSKAWVKDGDKTWELATFGPLAVEPALQGMGIGRLLLDKTLPLLKEAGFPAVIIMGEPHYYPKLGFKHCGEFGIKDAEGNCRDAMLAYPLSDSFSQVHGTFYESPDIPKCDDPALLEAAEKEFPPYPKIKIQDGFLQLHENHFGFVKSAGEGKCVISFWEEEYPAHIPDGLTLSAGDVVIFKGGKNSAAIVKRCENLI